MGLWEDYSMKMIYLNQEIEFLHNSDKTTNNPSELLQLDFLEYVRSLKLGGNYIDIGPNFGTFGVYYSLFCRSKKVYCYDLEQGNISDARKNISQNILDEKCSLELLQINGDIKNESLEQISDISVISLQGNAIPSEFLSIFRIFLLRYHPVVFMKNDIDELHVEFENILTTCGYIENRNVLKETNFSEFISANYEHKKYFDVSDYWESRYQSGRNSGSGSYGRLAKFKAKFLNNFLTDNLIKSAVELGCGDGAQLSQIRYPEYIGLDISPTVISLCEKKFQNDASKKFCVYDPENFNAKEFGADLSISLDVIYHLSNDDIYYAYLRDLFSLGIKYVIIYSNSTNNYYKGVNERLEYVKFREVLNDVMSMFSEWSLIGLEPNPYPFNLSIPDETSFADFLIFQKKPGVENIFKGFDQFISRKMANQLITNAEQTDLVLKENQQAHKFLKSSMKDLAKDVPVLMKMKDLGQEVRR